MKSAGDGVFFSAPQRAPLGESEGRSHSVEQAAGYVADGGDRPFLAADSLEGRRIIGQRLVHGGLEVLNGSFAYVRYDAETRRLHLVTDRMGTIPIYYAATNGEVACGTDWKRVARSCDLDALSSAGVTDLLVFGYCLGERTTIDRLHQCLPATHTVLQVLGKAGADSGPGIEKKRYWRYTHTDSIHTYQDFEKRMSDVVHSMETKYVALLKELGLEVLAKLSGGYDSRLTATMLAKHIPIKCASYGSRLYTDRILSRIVADEIGVPHIDCRVHGAELTSPDRTRDVARCVGAHSLSYVAIGSHVIRSHYRNRRCAWVPGFMAYIAPGAIPADMRIRSLTCAVDECIVRHCLLRFGRPTTVKEVSDAYVLFDSLHADIEEYFRAMASEGAEPFWMLHRYDMENRQAHHILSDAEFLRLSGVVVMPLFCNEIVDLFDSCSAELLFDRNAYKKYLRDTNFTLGDQSRLGRIPCSHLTFRHLLSGVRPRFALDYALALALSPRGRTSAWRQHARRYVASVSEVALDSLTEELLPAVTILGEVVTDRGLAKLRESASWVVLDALYTLKHVQETLRTPEPAYDSTLEPARMVHQYEARGV